MWKDSDTDNNRLCLICDVIDVNKEQEAQDAVEREILENIRIMAWQHEYDRQHRLQVQRDNTIKICLLCISVLLFSYFMFLTNRSEEEVFMPSSQRQLAFS